MAQRVKAGLLKLVVRVQFPLVAHISTIFIAHCHLLSPSGQLDTTEILLKGHEKPSHPSLSVWQQFWPNVII